MVVYYLKQKQPKFSDSISAFLNMVQEASADYNWNQEEIDRLEKLTQDYLHTMELNDTPYKETAKIGTQIKRCRQLRRKSKDTVMVLKPLIEFIDSDKGKMAINLMREMLGKTRKVEKSMSNRAYRYRVLDKPDIT